MLVLTRELRQRIMIGQDIVIEVVKLGREKVQLGITAPKNMPVYREEVLEEINRRSTLILSPERSGADA